MRTKKWQFQDRETRDARDRSLLENDPDKAQVRTLQRAVKLLAARPFSKGELRDRLLEKKWTNTDIVDAVIRKLSGYGYLNDERFALGFASYQVRQKPIGSLRLRMDLSRKKVDEQIAADAIRQVMDETPEETLLDCAIERRTRLRGRPETRQEVKNLFDHLLRRGFPSEMILRKIKRLSIADINED